MAITPTALPVTNKITIDSDKSVSFNEISIQFGDGYQQIAPNGTNFKKDSWNITWAPLTATEKTTIEAALDGNGSWGVFSWTPLGESVSKNFRVDRSGYTRKTLNRTNLFSISCKLVQCFDV